MSVVDPAPASPAGAHADRLLADAARAADLARARLHGALNDLFRAPASRLSDRDHAVMTRMLTVLLDEIEADLRSQLIKRAPLSENPELVEKLVDRDFPIARPKLARSRIMRDNELTALLLRRCDEHHIGAALRSAYPDAPAKRGSRMDSLTHHANAAIAEAASGLLVAESRRLDPFGEPIINRADLPIELQHRMTWWIAAALRDHMLAAHQIEPAVADRAIVAAVTAILANYDEREGMDARASELASRLRRAHQLEDGLIAAMLQEGHLMLWVAALAARGLIDSGAVWTMLADADASRLTLLLRAIAMERRTALGLLTDLFAARAGGGAVSDATLAQAAAAFDELSIDQAVSAIRAWRLDDQYRWAIAGLDAADGERR